MLEEGYRKQLVLDNKPCIAQVVDATWNAESQTLFEYYVQVYKAFLLVYAEESAEEFDKIRQIHAQILELKDEPPPIILLRNKADWADEANGSLPRFMRLPARSSRPFASALAYAAARRNASRSSLYNLPDEILIFITGHLDWISAVALCLSSKRLYAPRLWKYAHNSSSMRQGLTLGTELGCGFFEVSAKTGVNVDRAFHSVIRQLIELDERFEILDKANEAGRVCEEKKIKGVKGALGRAEIRVRRVQNKCKTEYTWVKERLGAAKY